MNSLSKILLVGTLVPAIALAPLAAALAQAPDQERGNPGTRPPPMRAPGGPGGAMPPHGEGMRAGPAGGMEHHRAEAPERPPAARAPAAALERTPSSHPAQAPRPLQTGASPAQERTPRAADMQRTSPTQRMPLAEQPRREATDPAARPQRDASPSPADRAGPPPVMPRNAAQDQPHRTPGTAPRAPGEDAAQGERRGMPNNAADRGPNEHMQNGMPGNRMQGDNRLQGDRTPGNQVPPQAGPRDASRNHDHGVGPGGAAAIGAAAGFAGGFLAATVGAQRLDDIRHDRREVVEDGRTYIREPGRTIVEDGGRSFIVHDENDRFRELGYDVHRERQGRDYVDTVDRPGGVQIITYTDADGRMLRRVRRDRDGREFVLIDNGVDGRVRPYQDDVVDLPPPPLRLARDRYIVDYRDADEGLIYDTLVAPPLAAPPQRYTLDQIRYSPDVRSYVRSVDINTINFDTASWIVPGSATGKLEALASAIKRAVGRNPNSVFLVEGYTDATGNPTDNLSLSDRRAQSVAAVLTKSFGVPPENLTTQGYGQQNLKVNTPGPSVENRRVVVQNVTQLLASGGQAPPQE